MTGSLPDDTELDALSAQVRAFAPLPDTEVERLLGEVRAAPGGGGAALLVEQSLAQVLDAVLGRRATGIDVMDLYQEGSVAATVAVGEYAARGGGAAGLRTYVARVVNAFLDDVVEREEAQRVADALLVEQAKLAEAAELTLRRTLEREPTILELAGLLQWPPERVEVVVDALHLARARYDSEIVEYLDDDES
jgi:DNA-directed RNA polymerase specialized sigma subunit